MSLSLLKKVFGSGFFFQLTLASVIVSGEAHSGSITGNVGSSFMDPCAHPTGTTGTCTAALSAQYLERCLANFEGTNLTQKWNPDSCTSGHCQGWKITTRSKVLVTDLEIVGYSLHGPVLGPQYCTNRRLHILGEIPTGTALVPALQVCQNTAGQVSRYIPGLLPQPLLTVKSIIMNPPNINSIPLPSYTDQSPLGPTQRKINYRRVYVRAADPDGVFFVPGAQTKEKYLYSLSLKDAICTWKKFCNPNAPGLKPGVPTTGEALLPGATAFDKDHPIARMCQLDPRWHMSNAAVSCAITQSGGIDALCSTPDPLHKNPALGHQ
jgi:hypothetical protein